MKKLDLRSYWIGAFTAAMLFFVAAAPPPFQPLSRTVYSGTVDPNLGVVRPIVTAVDNIYIQTTADNVPINVWYWVAGSTNWR